MPIAGIQLTVALLGTLLALLVLLRRGPSRPGLVSAALILLAATTAVAFAELRRPPRLREAEVVNRPIQEQEGGYVSSKTCKSCHPGEYASWFGSYHRTMTQVATPAAVIGDFSGQDLFAYGKRYRLERSGERYFVEMDGPPSAAGAPSRVRAPIVMTTGSHHMQAYWYSTGDRRELAILPFVYLKEEGRWILERASYLKPPLSGLGDSDGLWNHSCQQCHATAPQPQLQQLDTRTAELGIACEACHGPCEAHVRENRSPQRRYELHGSDRPDPTVVNPERLPEDRASEVCGQCHGVWEAADKEESDRSLATGFTYLPGQELKRSKLTMHRADKEGALRLVSVSAREQHFFGDRFWNDGVIRVAGREHVGLLDSPCYTHGDPSRPRWTCLSCHAMHQPRDDPRPRPEWANDQLKPRMDGNEACLQCHGDLRDKLEAHTHHRADSSGSACYNCHMPYTSYALLKAIRSHTIDIPSVASSVTMGRPNGCNQCHLDKTLAWTADRLHEWYGIEKPQLGPDETNIAASLLWLLRGDAGQRALLAWSMGWSAAQKASGSDWLIPHLAPLLVDTYDAVRFIAHRSLRTLPGCSEIEYDFLGPQPQRDAALQKALGIWRQRGTNRTTGPAILIQPDFDLERATWTRLLEQRDHRRVNLEE